MPHSEKRTTAIDWAAVHRRVEGSRQATERRAAPTQEEKRKLLRARAKALAQERRRDGAAADSLEIVEFLLAHERYGIESGAVREIYPLRDFTPLPGTPPFVLGVVNVRGEILSVLDLKKFFDLPEKGLTDLNKVLVVETPEMKVGILADKVLGVRPIAATEIQAGLPTLTGIRADYLKGITNDRIVILDAEAVLGDKRILLSEHPSAASSRGAT